MLSSNLFAARPRPTTFGSKTILFVDLHYLFAWANSISRIIAFWSLEFLFVIQNCWISKSDVRSAYVNYGAYVNWSNVDDKWNKWNKCNKLWSVIVNAHFGWVVKMSLSYTASIIAPRWIHLERWLFHVLLSYIQGEGRRELGTKVRYMTANKMRIVQEYNDWKR